MCGKRVFLPKYPATAPGTSDRRRRCEPTQLSGAAKAAAESSLASAVPVPCKSASSAVPGAGPPATGSGPRGRPAAHRRQKKGRTPCRWRLRGCTESDWHGLSQRTSHDLCAAAQRPSKPTSPWAPRMLSCFSVGRHPHHRRIARYSTTWDRLC